MAGAVSGITTSSSVITITSNIWTQWNDVIGGSVTTSYTTPDYIYSQWANSYTTSSNCATSSIWVRWVQEDSATELYAPAIITVSAPAVITAAEQAEMDAERERIAAFYREKDRKIKEANKVAEALLLKHLAPKQQEEYQQQRYFELFSKDGKRRYRINHGWAGNVDVFEGDRMVERLCIHPTVQVPYADNMLAQKLMLEADEKLFRKTANITKLAA